MYVLFCVYCSNEEAWSSQEIINRVTSPGDGLWMHRRHVDSQITLLSVVVCISWMIVGGARKSCDHRDEQLHQADR